MAVKLEFDHANVVNAPTIVLAKKGGKKLGTIPATSIHFDDNFNSMNTITFKVNNENSGIKTRLWNEIKNNPYQKKNVQLEYQKSIDITSLLAI